METNDFLKELGVEPKEYNVFEDIEGFKTWINKIKDDVLCGVIDPMAAYGLFELVEKTAKGCKDQIKSELENEFKKYGQKTVEKYGFRFTFIEGRKTYTYDNSKTWASLNFDLKEYEKQMKTVADSLANSKEIPEQLSGIEPAEVKNGESFFQIKFK